MMGSGLVLAGLALFMVVFFTLFPILTNPVNAYDNWFPVEETATEPVVAAVDQADPIARFSWEAIVVEALEPPVYRVRLQSTSLDGAAAIEAWQWDFGDSSGDRGDRVVHDYGVFGAYVVTLTVVDTDGRSDTVSGEIAVPGVASTAGGVGVVNEFIDLNDIDTSIQNAVGSVGAEIRSSIDGAVGSIGASARGAVVVFLFIMAAIATTIVAWRVARIGVMILNGVPDQSPRPPPSPDYDDFDRQRQLEVV